MGFPALISTTWKASDISNSPQGQVPNTSEFFADGDPHRNQQSQNFEPRLGQFSSGLHPGEYLK